MSKQIVLCLAICAMAATTAAEAQSRGGARHGHGGGDSSDSAPNSTSSHTPPPKPDDLNKVEIIGVVKAIDPEAGRLTIDYEAVEALNWPKGSMPFVVAKAALLQGVTVGEKIRFKIVSQEISELRPF